VKTWFVLRHTLQLFRIFPLLERQQGGPEPAPDACQKFDDTLIAPCPVCKTVGFLGRKGFAWTGISGPPIHLPPEFEFT